MLKFEADDKIFKLVIKVHRFNYQDIVTASGVFDGHILNLRFVGDYEQVYRIMQGYEKTTSTTLPTQPIEELTAEEAAAILFSFLIFMRTRSLPASQRTARRAFP